MKYKEDELNEHFQGINVALGSAFELDENLPAHVETKELVEYQEEKEGNILTESEVKYIEGEIKETVQSIVTVMDTLEQDLQIGSEARKFEVYATLATAKINAVNSLRDLRLAQKKLHIEEKKASLREIESQRKSDNVNNGTIVNVNGGLSFDDMRELSNQIKEILSP